MKTSIVGIGTWQFGGEWGKEFSQNEVTDILAAARDEGINLIDTAECYGFHHSEELIGSAIQGQRDKWIVATKFGHKFHGDFDRSTDFSPRGVQSQLHASLKALRTDYVDLYQFHSGPMEQLKNDGLWQMLALEKKKGTIRHLGISIRRDAPEPEQLAQVERAIAIGVETIQIVFNRLDHQPEERVLPRCKDLHLGVLARVPLASGFLSGKYDENATFPESDVRSRDAAATKRQIRDAIRIKSEEVPEGVNMAQWALAWCLKHQEVSTVIPGAKNVEQVRSNAGAIDLA